MKILFIHGMNQQQYTAKTLEQHWLHIFQQGLNNAQSTLRAQELNIRFAFYGDLLQKHRLANTLDLNTLLPKSFAQHFPLHLHPHLTGKMHDQDFIPFLLHDSAAQTLPFSEKLALFTALSKDMIFKELSILLNHFPKLHDALIHRFLIETYLYLSNECFTQEVHARILQTLDCHEPHIVVAHSLGTIIAYNLLYAHPEFAIQDLITLGSPLVFRVIQDKIQHPIRRPAGISGNWINFYSSDDFLTAFPLSEPPFNFQPAIINRQIQTFAAQPHEIMGYLQHPDVIHEILSALEKR